MTDFSQDPMVPLRVLARTLSDFFERTVEDEGKTSYWNEFIARGRESESDGLSAYPWNINSSSSTDADADGNADADTDADADANTMDVIESLPTFIYAYLMSSSSSCNKTSRRNKRRRLLHSIGSTSNDETEKALGERYMTCLGYILTQFYVNLQTVIHKEQDEEYNESSSQQSSSRIIIRWKDGFDAIQRLLRQTFSCGREQSSDWRQFHVGLILFLLDGMVRSTLYYEDSDEKINEEEILVVINEGKVNGYGRLCFLDEYDLDLQGFDVPFVVNALLEDDGCVRSHLVGSYHTSSITSRSNVIL